jgi:hypothetical protein
VPFANAFLLTDTHIRRPEDRIRVFDAAGMQRINLGIETEIKLLDGCLVSMTTKGFRCSG